MSKTSCSVDKGAVEIYFDESSTMTSNFSVISGETMMCECNFDEDVPELYQSIQKKNWTDSTRLADAYPEQASTWIFRKEKNGKLRWKLLPLHAAIIFKAPENVVESLLVAYPDGSRCTDDQGMLPIHLAFRNGGSVGIVNILLESFPRSINIKDKKGRVPLVLAQTSPSPNKEAFIRALEKGPSYYAEVVAAAERAVVEKEKTKYFDAKIQELKKGHEIELIEQQEKSERDYEKVVKKFAKLKSDSDRWKTMNDELADKCSMLEIKLKKKLESETYLKQLAIEKDNFQTKFKDEVQTSSQLQSEVQELRKLNKHLESKIEDLEDSNNCKDRITFDERKLFEEKLAQLKNELATKKASMVVTEAQIKAKQASEQSMALQLSELASNHAESIQTNKQMSAEYVKREAELTNDKQVMKMKLEKLITVMKEVAKVMNGMVDEQNTVLESAIKNEEAMRQLESRYSAILAASEEQEKMLSEAEKRNAAIMDLVAAQTKSLANLKVQKTTILNAVLSQGELLNISKTERDRTSDASERYSKKIVSSMEKIGTLFTESDPETGPVTSETASIDIATALADHEEYLKSSMQEQEHLTNLAKAHKAKLVSTLEKFGPVLEDSDTVDDESTLNESDETANARANLKVFITSPRGNKSDPEIETHLSKKTISPNSHVNSTLMRRILEARAEEEGSRT